mmetsp:Transcript_65865/g.184135  ORF Transcript_65865/g.184135 Transcript_65865/m.184135 type:complete len:234 (-) Transcript_65865:191-892(-)
MSLLKTSTTTMALLTTLPSMSSAWTVTTAPHGGQRGNILSRRSTATAQSSASQRQQRAFILQAAGPFFGPEEEFACPDEEECEIDWDAMPGFEGNDESSSKLLDDDVDEDESDVDMQPRPTFFGSQALESFDKGRVRLEMNWQIDECETDKDSCADFCPDCAGSGRQPCRFCRGTGIVSFGNEFRRCLICTKAVVGQEDCASCRGTGQIAPWASTMEEHLHLKSDEQKPKNFI